MTRLLGLAAVSLPALVLHAGCDDHLLGGDAAPVDGSYTCDLRGVTTFFEEQGCNACHGVSSFDLEIQLGRDLADKDDTNNYLFDTSDPTGSRLWSALTWPDDLDPGFRMPQLAAEPLPDDQIAHILCWIEAGAPLN